MEHVEQRSPEQPWEELKQAASPAKDAYGFLDSEDELEVEIPQSAVESTLDFSNMKALTQGDY